MWATLAERYWSSSGERRRRALRALLSRVNTWLGATADSADALRPLITHDRTFEEVRRFLLSLEQPDERAKEYLQTHVGRLATTVLLAPPSGGSGWCLELGSYMHLPAALTRFKGYTHICVAGMGRLGDHVVATARSKAEHVLSARVDLFDAERDVFPYDDEAFELVLACEVIEHLRTDPMHMLFEIHRVLASDGTLLITTPNCASLASLEQILWRTSKPYTYSVYPGPQADREYGPGHHIREYTPDELVRTVEAAGFAIQSLLTRPGRAVETKGIIGDLLLRYGFPTALRGEQMYCLARKEPGKERTRFPDFLYDY